MCACRALQSWRLGLEVHLCGCLLLHSGLQSSGRSQGAHVHKEFVPDVVPKHDPQYEPEHQSKHQSEYQSEYQSECLSQREPDNKWSNTHTNEEPNLS